MIPGEHPVNTARNRRIFGLSEAALATPATAEVLAVAPWPALIPDLRALLWQASRHRRMAGPLEPDLAVVGGQVPLGLTPSVREQVLQPRGRRLPKFVGAGDPHVEALVEDFLVVGHARERVAGDPERPSGGRPSAPERPCRWFLRERGPDERGRPGRARRRPPRPSS